MLIQNNNLVTQKTQMNWSEIFEFVSFIDFKILMSETTFRLQ